MVFRRNFGEYKLVEVGEVSPPRLVPGHIKKPCYHETGVPAPAPELPEIKSKEQIEKMRCSCKLAANILKTIEKSVKV